LTGENVKIPVHHRKFCATLEAASFRLQAASRLRRIGLEA